MFPFRSSSPLSSNDVVSPPDVAGSNNNKALGCQTPIRALTEIKGVFREVSNREIPAPEIIKKARRGCRTPAGYFANRRPMKSSVSIMRKNITTGRSQKEARPHGTARLVWPAARRSAPQKSIGAGIAAIFIATGKSEAR